LRAYESTATSGINPRSSGRGGALRRRQAHPGPYALQIRHVTDEERCGGRSDPALGHPSPPLDKARRARESLTRTGGNGRISLLRSCAARAREQPCQVSRAPQSLSHSRRSRRLTKDELRGILAVATVSGPDGCHISGKFTKPMPIERRP